MACLKKKYRDKLEAERALKTINKAVDNRQIKPIRCYYCTNCKNWHITHNIMFDSGGRYFKLKFERLWKKLIK